MSEKSNFNIKSIFEKIKNNKLLQYLLIIILLIIAVLFVFVDFSSNTDDTVIDDVSEYVISLEKRLTNTLSKVDGAGKVSVVISVKSGMETVLAMETVVKETGGIKETVETPVIVNGKTVVLKELYPEITGVLIVAEGASNISVMNKMQQATMSLLDININQIEILSMK